MASRTGTPDRHVGASLGVGLQLAAGEVCRAEVRRRAGRFEVVALERLPLTVPTSGNGDGKAHTSRASSGDRSAGRIGSLPDDGVCVASLPAADVMTRCWSFPRSDDARMKQMVANRLEADLPVAIDQVAWGYRQADADGVAEPTVDVRAQAVRQDRMARQSAALKTSGIEPDILTTEAEGLAALCRYGLKPPAGGSPADREALILANADHWTIAVALGGIIRVVRHIEVRSGLIDLACRECGQTIETVQPVRDLRRVRWAATPDMEEAHHALTEQLGVAVEDAGPADDLVDSRGSRLTAETIATFGPAIGLCLAGMCEGDRLIRFGERERRAASPRQERVDRLLARPVRWSAIAVGLILLACAIHLLAIGWETRRMNALLAGYDQNTSTMAAIEPKYRAMERLRANRIGVEHIVASVCAQIPNNVVITSLDLSRERGLTIKGTCDDLKAMFKWVEELRKNPRFSDVQIGRTEPGKGGSFSITAELSKVRKLSTIGGRGGRWP